jgi:hypothetical protein
MIKSFKKSATLAAAALAIGVAVMPISSAEARFGRNGALIGGLAAGALIGGALLAAPRAYAAPVYGPGPVYIEEPACYNVRERVWDDYRGRWVRVTRRVCD